MRALTVAGGAAVLAVAFGGLVGAQDPPLPMLEFETSGTMLRARVDAGNGWLAYRDIADLATLCPAFLETQSPGETEHP